MIIIGGSCELLLKVMSSHYQKRGGFFVGDEWLKINHQNRISILISNINEGRKQTCGPPQEQVLQRATPSLMHFHLLLQYSSDLLQVLGEFPCCHPSHAVCLSIIELQMLVFEIYTYNENNKLKFFRVSRILLDKYRII